MIEESEVDQLAEALARRLVSGARLDARWRDMHGRPINWGVHEIIGNAVTERALYGFHPMQPVRMRCTVQTLPYPRVLAELVHANGESMGRCEFVLGVAE